MASPKNSPRAWLSPLAFVALLAGMNACLDQPEFDPPGDESATTVVRITEQEPAAPSNVAEPSPAPPTATVPAATAPTAAARGDAPADAEREEPQKKRGKGD